MPKVSVIIPTYNRADCLKGALQSVLNQTFQDFEIIVVDDGSKDNTAEVMAGCNDQRIKYIRHESNKGEGGSRNTGVLNSRGEYVAFLDDDDEWLPEKLEKQVALLDRSPGIVGGIYTGMLSIYKSNGQIRLVRVPTKRGYIFPDMIQQNWVRTATTVMLRKTCFEKVGLFDENVAFGPDYDMWLRISKEFHFEYISEPLAKYYVHDKKMSTNVPLRIRGLEVMLKKHAGLFAADKRSYSRRYRFLGALYCYNKEPAKGRKAFVNAIAIDPYEFRNYASLFFASLGAANFRRIRELWRQISSNFRSGQKTLAAGTDLRRN